MIKIYGCRKVSKVEELGSFVRITSELKDFFVKVWKEEVGALKQEKKQ